MEKFEKPYLESEKELFKKLSDDEKSRRISELGKEGAIQQYGYELTLKSMEKKEKELSSEEKEDLEKIEKGVKNVLSLFELKRSPDNKRGENLIVITDEGVDELIRAALFNAAKAVAADDARVIVIPSPRHPTQDLGEYIGEKVKNADAILLATSMSRTHSKEMIELYQFHPSELIAKLQKIRIGQRGSMVPGNTRQISITNTTREIFTEGGALENFQEMEKRTKKFKEFMEDVNVLQITSNLGTNLQIKIKKDTALGEMLPDKPGKGCNFPFGEWSAAVEWEETSGKVVIDGAIPVFGRVDRPITIELENGRITSIQGGKAAKKLKEMLTQAKGKGDAFKIAEIGIGMNSRAFRYDEKGEKISPPTSLEGEKGLGTIHVAFGRNTLFGIKPDDPHYNPIEIHVDCVVMKPSVIASKIDGSKVKFIKNGEYLL